MSRAKDIRKRIENVIETIAGYPVKNLSYNEKRDYIGGHVKDPRKGNPLINNGFVGCSWFPNGDALPKLTKFGSKKPRPDLKLKIND